jgi:hypothetical protein
MKTPAEGEPEGIIREADSGKTAALLARDPKVLPP